MRKIIPVMILIIGVFGCDDIIELEDISNSTVILVAPYDAAVLKTNILNFSWQTMADDDDYQIQIASPDFESPLQIVVDSTISRNNLSVNLEYNIYEWRVRAKNSGYETNYSKQSFTLEE